MMIVSVLSDKPELREGFCKSLGKEESKGEMAFYSSGALTLIDPVGYPEKVQPLLHAVAMSDFAVVLVDSLTPKIGEIIVALNSLKCERGLIVSKSPLPVAGTTLEKFEKAPDAEAAKAKLQSLPAGEAGETVLGLIERTEAVKAVGNVAHGVLKSGKLKKSDRLFILPENKEVEVRSLSVSGREAEEAGPGLLSMAYKGELAGAGILVPLRHEQETGNVINGRFMPSPFYKDELKGKIHAYTNMQFVEGHLSDNDLTLSGPISYEKGELILVVDASNQKLRIAGAFQSKW
jgi:hypothetical protein